MLNESRKPKIRNRRKLITGSRFLLFIFCFFLSALVSCNQFWISGILKRADEAQIQFYKKDSTDKTISIITIIDKEELEKVESFISDKEVIPLKCGYDGTIRFKSKGETLIDTEFNLQADCRHIAFVLNNKVQYRELTDEGFKYLSALKKQ